MRYLHNNSILSIIANYYNKVDWSTIRYVGFDLDGTLYDEFEFIAQVYREIHNLFFKDLIINEFMLIRWLEKGSSYNKIFEEAYDLYKERMMNFVSKEEFVEMCLEIYRNFEPKLNLPARNQFILELLSKNYTLFLISDGNPILQRRKFTILGLDKFFKEDFVLFTGDDPENLAKPKIKSIEKLNISPQESVYFGDRDLDKLFAKNAGMQFQKVYNMIPVE